MVSAYDNINRKLLCDSSSFVLLWLLMPRWHSHDEIFLFQQKKKKETCMWLNTTWYVERMWCRFGRVSLTWCRVDTWYRRTKLTSLSNRWGIIKCMLSFHRCWVFIIILGRFTSLSLLKHIFPTFIANLESPKSTSRGLVIQEGGIAAPLPGNPK